MWRHLCAIFYQKNICLETYIGSATDVTSLRPEEDVLKVELDLVTDVRHFPNDSSNLKKYIALLV